jgi:hypothetical protein
MNFATITCIVINLFFSQIAAGIFLAGTDLENETFQVLENTM